MIAQLQLPLPFPLPHRLTWLQFMGCAVAHTPRPVDQSVSTMASFSDSGRSSGWNRVSF